MNGIHDMGGMQCFGTIHPESNEPVFHADWEKSVLAMTVAMGATGVWNLDETRSARESIPPQQYLTSSYYQIWLAALENMMLARGMITPEELCHGKSEVSGLSLPRVLKVDSVKAALLRGSPSERASNAQPKFQVGQRVRMKNFQPTGHTRLPRYVRGKVGVIQLNHGPHVLPDEHAKSNDSKHDIAEHLYTVVFSGQELWGSQAHPGDSVSVDAWERYLEVL